jgi:hypothetical protein
MKRVLRLITSLILFSFYLFGCTDSGPGKAAAQQKTFEPSAAASPADSGSNASERVSFANGKVSFVPPAGFRPMTQEQIDKKFPPGNAPKHVFANERQSVSVGITFSPAKVSPDQLPEIKAAFEQMLPKMVPGLKWQNQELVEINGTKWARFKFISRAIDTNIQNDMYVTSFRGRALIFGFNSIVSQYDEVQASFAESRNSIKITQ